MDGRTDTGHLCGSCDAAAGLQEELGDAGGRAEPHGAANQRLNLRMQVGRSYVHQPVPTLGGGGGGIANAPLRVTGFSPRAKRSRRGVPTAPTQPGLRGRGKAKGLWSTHC
jgi:hypothetical protein